MSKSRIDGGMLAFAFAGMLGFAGGVYLIVTGNTALGIAVLAMGIAFEALTLARVAARAKNNKDGGNA